MAFTGVVMLTGDDLDEFYKYVTEIIGRPIYSHEMGILAEEIKEKSRADFLELCKTAVSPKTNGDSIRQMEDEELAENLLLNSNYFTCSKCTYKSGCKGKKCKDAAIEWLRKKVNEDNGTN
jgi:hypothetical protein